MFYVLALLNSKIAWYFARKVLIRTNNISANYLRLMPYKEPILSKKKKIASLVETIITNQKKDENYDYSKYQRILDQDFFKIYNLSDQAIEKINHFCENFYETL